jgi:signal transduction histidine kinase
MQRLAKGFMENSSNQRILLGYVANLELEVDRLRRQNQFVSDTVKGTLRQIQFQSKEGSQAGNAVSALAEIDRKVLELAAVLWDLRESPGYHPAHDQVVVIAVRPLVEQVFRLHQRIANAPQVALQLKLQSEHLDWFPARLRHILDNLFSNALKYRDFQKPEEWVRFELNVSPEWYEFRVSDNGVGMPPDEREQILELFHRAAPTRQAGLGVGLAVVKLLVEQSGGTLTVDSGEGQGTSVFATVPRYDVDDFLI